MSKVEKLLAKILSGESDNSITFAEAVKALEYAGFKLARVRGSHHLFKRGSDRLTIPVHGQTIKPVYVKQLRKLLK